MRLPHWVSGGARPDRKWGDMGAKSPGTSKRERCGSSLPINRYFFAFFPRRCDRPNKRSDGASWGSETPIADVIDANDDFRFVPRADLHRIPCPVLEITVCVHVSRSGVDGVARLAAAQDSPIWRPDGLCM